MELNTEKIDKSALALLYLTLHDEFRAWKSIDWGVTNWLYEKGLIQNSVNKNKSIVFTEKGLEEAERCFRELFDKKWLFWKTVVFYEVIYCLTSL